MHVIGRDHEPPVFVGPGHIDITSSTVIDFTMFASATDQQDAIRRINRAQGNPYDACDQFRLIATDYEDTEWICGWILPNVKNVTTVGWLLTGRINGLLTRVSGPWVSTDSSVELVFHPQLWLPMEKAMESVSFVDGQEIARKRSSGQQTIHALESEVNFFYTPTNESLWVTAKTSDKLKHPFAENWISEPLRILLGQLVFPRLVARNFGNGTADVWLRASPRHFSNSGLASLLQGIPFEQPENFWNLYASLLTLIAEARDEQGQPNFESKRITRFYEEIVQATQGSRWVLCLTLASTAEGLATMLMRPDERKSDFDSKDIEGLKSIIKAWEGSNKLKNRVLGWFPLLMRTSVSRYLRDLVGRGVLKTENERAWDAVRNAVTHGNLVSPWPTQEEDERILALADLVHRLTHQLIREHAKVKEDQIQA
jgi:hypothetical protein